MRRPTEFIVFWNSDNDAQRFNGSDWIGMMRFRDELDRSNIPNRVQEKFR